MKNRSCAFRAIFKTPLAGKNSCQELLIHLFAFLPIDEVVNKLVRRTQLPF